MDENIFGHKDLFSFYKKVTGPFAIDDSLFGKSSDEGLNATVSGNAGLSAVLFNSVSHAPDVCNIALVSRQGKGPGLSFAQILSSSPCGGRDVTASFVNLYLMLLLLF
ncbi:hypothetical protein PanWU01x14_268670 [Parasponia andersonii]|uniref:Uncharacterized protein n=1 Tax=Parasponia andersonii TaxID=3476 RepID=A0A2P5B5Y4_PARAD|nr:hypothetical protein PanWU01x14_268670 [Parasponia andersonii]